MINKEVFDYIKKNKATWTAEMLNTTDSMLLWDIKDKRDIRSAFGVEEQEELIYYRDSSFWNTRNQGCVITDWGIRVIPDNDKPEDIIAFPWEEVDHVTYKDDVLFFWCESEEKTDNSIPIHNTYFSKNDVPESRWKALANLFSQVAKMVQPQEHPIWLTLDRIAALADSGNLKEAEKIGREVLGRYPEYDYLINFYLGHAACFNFKDAERAKRYLSASLEDENNDIDYFRTGAHYLLASNILIEEGLDKQRPEERLPNLKQFQQYRYHNFMAAKGDKNIEFPKGVSTADDAANDLFELENFCAERGFENLSYEDHKIICPVNNLLALSEITQTQIRPVQLSALKKSECLAFPLGHPVANEVYVCHPYDHKKYLLYENYEIELLEDKLREYCEIMQCLGATEIEVRVESSMAEDITGKRDVSVSGSAKSTASISGHYDEKTEISEQNRWARTFNRHQRFAATSEIKVPENTIWLAGEPDWQRAINQRLNGNLLSHHESISTSSSRVVTGSAARTLKAELQTLFVDLGMEWSATEESTYSNQTSLMLSVDVVFGNPEQKSDNAESVALSDTEKEYLEEFRLCLSGGEVSSSERRLLNRIAKELKLTDDQVARLEESVMAVKLTDGEQEYLNEYKGCLAEGEITAATRRLLDRLAQTLNLSADRIKELENL